jgi:hypothetical protein
MVEPTPPEIEPAGLLPAVGAPKPKVRVPKAKVDDNFSERGARGLAARIREYWAKRGWDVAVRCEEIISKYTAKSKAGEERIVYTSLWVVRSDLDGRGLPVRRLAALELQAAPISDEYA